jgi:hypothetical protein
MPTGSSVVPVLVGLQEAPGHQAEGVAVRELAAIEQGVDAVAGRHEQVGRRKRPPVRASGRLGQRQAIAADLGQGDGSRVEVEVLAVGVQALEDGDGHLIEEGPVQEAPPLDLPRRHDHARLANAVDEVELLLGRVPQDVELVESNVVFVAGLAFGQRLVARGRGHDQHDPLAGIGDPRQLVHRPAHDPRAPVAPDATWIAVVPWMCGWYHWRPSWWVRPRRCPSGAGRPHPGPPG